MAGRRWLLLAAPVVTATATLAVTGCTNNQVQSVDHTQAARPTQRPADVAGPNDQDAPEDFPTPGPSPVWDAGARTAAIQAAGHAMAVFAQPRLGAAQWWSQLEPLLTDAAAVAYQGTDPANIPASSLTGRAALGATSSAYLAQVRVPTNAGRYTVLLVREDAASPWLVERITPPRAGAS